MERKYPVYRLDIWWEITNPMTKYDDMGNTVENSTIHRQYPVPPTSEALEVDVRKFWLAMLTDERGGPTLADRGAKLIGYSVEVTEIETWYQGRFRHMSLNVHLSDAELLDSFRQFVSRKREGLESYCLMGAEDDWRWKGPCRCEHCQARGIVRIDH